MSRKDTALTVHNIEGFDNYGIGLTIKKIIDGSHWDVNEKPNEVSLMIREFITLN
ncbi:MAG: hypothetical protein MUP22_04640 [Desulfobacterales bacterium]|nr:hypothetical protein [Desulfobacterales bacterium]